MCLKGLTIPHNLSLPKKISQRRKLGCRWRPAPPSHHVRYGMEHWKIPSEFSTLQWLAQFNCTFRWCGVHNFVHLSLYLSLSFSILWYATFFIHKRLNVVFAPHFQPDVELWLKHIIHSHWQMHHRIMCCQQCWCVCRDRYGYAYTATATTSQTIYHDDLLSAIHGQQTTVIRVLWQSTVKQINKKMPDTSLQHFYYYVAVRAFVQCVLFITPVLIKLHVEYEISSLCSLHNVYSASGSYTLLQSMCMRDAQRI